MNITEYKAELEARLDKLKMEYVSSLRAAETIEKTHSELEYLINREQQPEYTGQTAMSCVCML